MSMFEGGTLCKEYTPETIADNKSIPNIAV
jgi:hypothetical protein